MSNFHRLRLSYDLTEAQLCHVTVPVDTLKEGVRLERLHVLCTKALIWVQANELVNNVAAVWIKFHVRRPLDLAIVDLREDCVVLCAGEGDLTGDHLKDDAAESP